MVKFGWFHGDVADADSGEDDIATAHTGTFGHVASDGLGANDVETTIGRPVRS